MIEKELFLQEIDKLKKSSVIIVEGKKDIIALKKLGVSNTVEINMPLYKLCEVIAKNHSRAVILTDLDKEGRRLYSKLKENLERNGVKTDSSFREFLFKETKITQIEGLSNFEYFLA